MGFATYEELQAAVESRRNQILTLEVDLGAQYSQEHEDAKKELAQAQAIKKLAGNGGFLGDNIAALESRVAETKPDSAVVYLQYSRLTVAEFSMLMKQQGLSSIDQYERVIPKCFVGLFGEDPLAEDEEGNRINPDLKPLTTDAEAVSSRSDKTVIPGGLLHGVVQAFMSWQNSSGDISIRPTKSGRA